jgi:hypothetical protein
VGGKVGLKWGRRGRKERVGVADGERRGKWKKAKKKKNKYGKR